MGKTTISDIVHSYINPEEHDEGPSTSLISIRVPSDIKEDLNLLASVLNTKPSPLAAEIFIVALREAIDALPPEMTRPFEKQEEERRLIEEHRNR